MIRNMVGVLVKRNRRVLVVQLPRGPYAGQWALPGGKVEEGETYEMAAIRELREETGMEARKLVLLGTVGYADPSGQNWLGVLFQALDVEQGKTGLDNHKQKWVKQSNPGKQIPSLESFIARHPRLWLAEGPEIELLERLQFGDKKCKALSRLIRRVNDRDDSVRSGRGARELSLRGAGLVRQDNG